MILSNNSMLSQLMNPALKRALQHDSAPAGRAAPKQEPQSPWMKAGNGSRSSFEAARPAGAESCCRAFFTAGFSSWLSIELCEKIMCGYVGWSAG